MDQQQTEHQHLQLQQQQQLLTQQQQQLQQQQQQLQQQQEHLKHQQRQLRSQQQELLAQMQKQPASRPGCAAVAVAGSVHAGAAKLLVLLTPPVRQSYRRSLVSSGPVRRGLLTA